MTISGKTMVCGVMGYPVEHSLSPMMHNFYSQQADVDMIYIPFLVGTGEVRQAVEGAFALNIQGMNVTVPHKQAVMEYLSELDEDARAIGAVNTLVRTENGYKGYNTDASGMLRAMQDAGMDPRGKTCILLGAGGAAKAAAYVMVKAEASKVYVLNRNLQRAKQMADDINGLFGRTALFPMELDGWKEISERNCLAVQTTSVGMYPNKDQAVIEDLAFYEKLEMAFDVIYTPETTRFMTLAAFAGAKAENGLGMLIYQGITAYELWNPQVTISHEMIENVRIKMLEYLGGRA